MYIADQKAKNRKMVQVFRNFTDSALLIVFKSGEHRVIRLQDRDQDQKTQHARPRLALEDQDGYRTEDARPIPRLHSVLQDLDQNPLLKSQTKTQRFSMQG